MTEWKLSASLVKWYSQMVQMWFTPLPLTEKFTQVSCADAWKTLTTKIKVIRLSIVSADNLLPVLLKCIFKRDDYSRTLKYNICNDIANIFSWSLTLESILSISFKKPHLMRGWYNSEHDAGFLKNYVRQHQLGLISIAEAISDNASDIPAAFPTIEALQYLLLQSFQDFLDYGLAIPAQSLPANLDFRPCWNAFCSFFG